MEMGVEHQAGMAVVKADMIVVGIVVWEAPRMQMSLVVAGLMGAIGAVSHRIWDRHLVMAHWMSVD